MIEGCIDEVRDGVVYATLIDPKNAEYSVEIDLDRFAEVDQPHCRPGTLFIIDHPQPELKLRKSVGGGG